MFFVGVSVTDDQLLIFLFSETVLHRAELRRRAGNRISVNALEVKPP